MSSFIEVDDGNFQEKVLQSELPVLVEFGADWCVPCKRLEPLLERFQDERAEKVRLVHINVDKSTEVASRYQVQSLPTVILFIKGEPLQASYGLQSSDHLKESFGSLV